MNINVIAIIAVWGASILVSVIVARDTKKAYTALEELEELSEKLEELENAFAELEEIARKHEDSIYRLDLITDPEERRFL